MTVPLTEPSTEHTHGSHRLAITLGALLVPLVVVGVTVALALSWRDELPNPVASSWSSGRITGTSSLNGVLIATLTPVLAIALAAWLVALFVGRTTAVRRFAAGFACGLAVFICGLTVGMLAIQRGLTSADQAPGLGASLAVAAGAAVVVGVLVAVAMPADAPLKATGRVPADAPRARIAGTAGASWSGTVTFGQPGLAVGLVVSLVVAFGVIGWFAKTPWIVIPLVIALAVVGLMLGRWTVRVDDEGLLARTAIPRPRLWVPLNEIESAEVAQISPLRDFGGWGYRIGRGGRVGVVLRTGEAIVVHRSGDREVVITVDDARRGAALLNSLVEHTRR